MWSTCSIETGQAWTQAPQVTQSHTDSSGTALGTSEASSGATGPSPCSPRARTSVPPSAKTWSRSPMISSLGDSILPVVNAGQASWQRPHSVHENVSRTYLQLLDE